MSSAYDCLANILFFSFQFCVTKAAVLTNWRDLN